MNYYLITIAILLYVLFGIGLKAIYDEAETAVGEDAGRIWIFIFLWPLALFVYAIEKIMKW